MRVDDYLHVLRRDPRRGGRQAQGRDQRAVELCGLQRVTGKNIVELSKGYKQRVGLAQAIVHEPTC
jgi:ABC-2 type transport system ATP-binding protein